MLSKLVEEHKIKANFGFEDLRSVHFLNGSIGGTGIAIRASILLCRIQKLQLRCAVSKSCMTTIKLALQYIISELTIPSYFLLLEAGNQGETRDLCQQLESAIRTVFNKVGDGSMKPQALMADINDDATLSKILGGLMLLCMTGHLIQGGLGKQIGQAMGAAAFNIFDAGPQLKEANEALETFEANLIDCATGTCLKTDAVTGNLLYFWICTNITSPMKSRWIDCSGVWQCSHLRLDSWLLLIHIFRPW